MDIEPFGVLGIATPALNPLVTATTSTLKSPKNRTFKTLIKTGTRTVSKLAQARITFNLSLSEPEAWTMSLLIQKEANLLSRNEKWLGILNGSLPNPNDNSSFNVSLPAAVMSQNMCDTVEISKRTLTVFVVLYVPLLTVCLSTSACILYIYILSPRVRTISNSFVITLAVADSVLSLHMGYLTLSRFHFRTRNLDGVFCGLMAFLGSWTIAASFLAVTVLSYHRYVRLAQGETLYRQLYGSKKKVLLWCSSPFMLGALVSLDWNSSFLQETMTCYSSIGSQGATLVFYVIIYLFNLFFQMATYKRLVGFEMKSSLYVDPLKRQERQTKARYMRISLYLSMVNIHLYGPALLLDLVVLLTECQSYLRILAITMCELVLVVCCCANSILYGALNTNFRKQAHVICRCWRRKKPPSEDKSDDQIHDPGSVNVSVVSVLVGSLHQRWGNQPETAQLTTIDGETVKKRLARMTILRKHSDLCKTYKPSYMQSDLRDEFDQSRINAIEDDSLYHVKSIVRQTPSKRSRDSLLDMPDLLFTPAEGASVAALPTDQKESLTDLSVSVDGPLLNLKKTKSLLHLCQTEGSLSGNTLQPSLSTTTATTKDSLATMDSEMAMLPLRRLPNTSPKKRSKKTGMLGYLLHMMRLEDSTDVEETVSEINIFQETMDDGSGSLKNSSLESLSPAAISQSPSTATAFQPLSAVALNKTLSPSTGAGFSQSSVADKRSIMSAAANLSPPTVTTKQSRSSAADLSPSTVTTERLHSFAVVNQPSTSATANGPLATAAPNVLSYNAVSLSATSLDARTP